MATSVKSVIEGGIEGGKTIKFILSQVAKKCPSSKADEAHVRFYANKMVRDGKLTQEIATEKYGCGSRGRKPAADKPAAKATTKAKVAAKDKTKAEPKAKKVSTRKVKVAKDEGEKPAKKPRASKK